MPASEGRLIISSSAAIDLHNISISSGPRCSLPLANRAKTSIGLALQTAADICKASAEERESTNVPAQWESVSHSLRCCSSSVSLFSLSRRPFSWLRLKVLQHTWFIAGDSGGVAGQKEVTVRRASQERRINGSASFRQTPGSLLITAVRRFQPQL